MTPPLWQKVQRTKEPPDESESGVSKSLLKAQHSENYDNDIQSHHFMAVIWENNRNSETIFLGSKITADSDCRHEIKRRLLLGRNESVKVKASQLCPTLCIPMDYAVHGILQARILEWVAFPFSRGSSQPRD